MQTNKHVSVFRIVNKCISFCILFYHYFVYHIIYRRIRHNANYFERRAFILQIKKKNESKPTSQSSRTGSFVCETAGTIISFSFSFSLPTSATDQTQIKKKPLENNVVDGLPYADQKEETSVFV